MTLCGGLLLTLAIACTASMGTVAVLSALRADDPPPQASAIDSELQQRQQRELSDRLIRLAVENQLLASEAVKSHRIRVTVEDGIVTLSGQVRNLLAVDIAVGLTQRVRGVISVVDQLEANPVDRPDADLQQDVESALAADPVTRMAKVTVSVQDGTARLTGSVAVYGTKIIVGNVVRGVVGIQEIDDQLSTTGNIIRSDDELRQEVKDLLRYAVQLDQIQLDVAVEDGNVVLDGTVTSDFQRSFAEQLAWRAGAKNVDVRGIRVDWRDANPELRTARYEKTTDDQIRDAIVRGLRYDPRVLSFQPDVHVKRGVVTLSGIVGHLAAKRAAERVARFTVGVRRVNNQLNVDWPDKSPTDEEIAEYTFAAIRRDPYLNGEEIIVNSENAHVALHGIVENDFEKNHAEWTAARQKAVVHVDNYLTVRAKWIPKSDEAITADLQERLDFLFVNDDENFVTGRVTNGVALLEGSVDTWYLWQQVLDATMSAGAREPHMMIEVRHGTPASLRYSGPHSYIPQ